MFGYKSSKDRLIDFYVAELEQQRGYVKQLQQAAITDLARHRQEVDEQSSHAAEAVNLANDMLRLVPLNAAKSETLDPTTHRPRSMSTYLQELTDRSRKRAIAGKALVAPGVPVAAMGTPAGVKVAGN